MGAMIELPQISGGSEADQLRYMQRYLYKMAQQLNFALGAVEGNVARVMETGQSRKGGAASEEKSPKVTFNSIKALIIKSADIVDAYYQEINRRLEGQYVASSEFGTFSQETEQSIRENSEEIQRSFRNIQQIETDIAELDATLLDVNAYIKTGVLFYGENAVPVYGVEIGQQTSADGAVIFQKYARLTSGKLSFYDNNGAEVAYISDYRLHITAADIQELTVGKLDIRKLQMGDYTWFVGEDGHCSLS